MCGTGYIFLWPAIRKCRFAGDQKITKTVYDKVARMREENIRQPYFFGGIGNEEKSNRNCFYSGSQRFYERLGGGHNWRI